MLPVSACYRDKNWKEGGLVTILVVRCHPKETYTYGCYLVDMFCLGVKESFYKFSLSDIDLESFLRSYREKCDLEQITLFETGRTCEGIPEERWNEDYAAPLLHTLFFLGEVGDGDCLEIVFETLRQNQDYYDFHFGDSRNEVYVPTLYLLGKDRLPTLLSYMKELGLYTFARCMVPTAVALVARMHPERRSEVIDWFRNLLQFYAEELPHRTCCDGTLVGLIMSDLMDLHASELLPEIKAVFATGEVDKGCSGDYRAVEKEILNPSSGWLLDVYKTDIYERYEDYSKMWKK